MPFGGGAFSPFGAFGGLGAFGGMGSPFGAIAGPTGMFYHFHYTDDISSVTFRLDFSSQTNL